MEHALGWVSSAEKVESTTISNQFAASMHAIATHSKNAFPVYSFCGSQRKAEPSGL